MPRTKKSAAAVDDTAKALEPLEYPHRPVTIMVDGQDDANARGVAVMTPEQLEQRQARQMATAREVPDESQPIEQTAAPPAVDTSATLRTAAQAVSDARSNLEHTNERLTDIGEKSRQLNKLAQAITAAHALRAQLLANALIAGKKADIKKADEQLDQAVRAQAARVDEITAVARAQEILAAQQKTAEVKLAKCERAFKEARTAHVEAIAQARRLAGKFHEAVTTAQACIAQMPPHLAARLPKVDLDFLQRYSVQMQEVQDQVSSQAEGELVKADQLASIRPPEAPVEHLGYVWANGTIHQEPESAPSEPGPSNKLLGGTVGAQPGIYAS